MTVIVNLLLQKTESLASDQTAQHPARGEY